MRMKVCGLRLRNLGRGGFGSGIFSFWSVDSKPVLHMPETSELQRCAQWVPERLGILINLKGDEKGGRSLTTQQGRVFAALSKNKAIPEAEREERSPLFIPFSLRLPGPPKNWVHRYFSASNPPHEMPA